MSNLKLKWPEGTEREDRLKDLFNKVPIENFSNTDKESGNIIEKGHRNSNKIDQKQSSPQHIIIQLSSSEHKEKILK